MYSNNDMLGYLNLKEKENNYIMNADYVTSQTRRVLRRQHVIEVKTTLFSINK